MIPCPGRSAAPTASSARSGALQPGPPQKDSLSRSPYQQCTAPSVWKDRAAGARALHCIRDTNDEQRETVMGLWSSPEQGCSRDEGIECRKDLAAKPILLHQ